MNFAGQGIRISSGSIDLGLFYQAIFHSELAIYILRIGPDRAPTFEDANETVAMIAGRPLAEIRGRGPLECLPTEIGECLQNNLEAVVERGEAVTYERSLDLPTGRVAFRTSLFPVANHSGEIAHILGITRDITLEADLLDDAQHNAALLQRLGIALPSAVYLLNVRTQCIRFIGGDVDDRRQLWRADAEAAGSDAATRFFHPDDHRKAETHLRDLAELADGEVITVDYRILTASGEYRPHSNREIVFSRTPSGEVELVLGVSEDVTERDRAQQEVRDLSDRMSTLQIDERRRMAEELHDSTGQHLIAVALALSRIRMAVPALPDGCDTKASLDEALDDAKVSLCNAQREIRVLSYLLHPPEIVSQALGEALETFARGFGRRAGLDVEVHICPRANMVSDEISLNLLRICQEGLTNIYRHAEATKAVVLLDVDESGIRLKITDDGVGLDPRKPLGVGLGGMRERVARMGGELHISGCATGTVLLVVVPRSVS